MNTDQNHTPAEVATSIEKLSRRVRTHTRILEGRALSHGHNENLADVAARHDQQHATLAALVKELAQWEAVRDEQATPAAPPAPEQADGYDVPVDPMDDLQCDSCQ